MKIYTRTGDAGTTSLVGGKRVRKDSVRLDAYGSVDELNSFLGMLLASEGLESEAGDTLRMVQNKLFNVGAYLATDNTDNPMAEPSGLGHKAIGELERQIDLMTDRLPELRAFILPGGCPAAALANVCRAVCRRAERRVIALTQEARVDDIVIRFLNRLSDYLFTLGRYANHISGVAELEWRKE
jgi:cob(I)alamin adenosyltransferase